MNEQRPEATRDEDLQQQLWEFVYDLLPPDEADALVERISRDPHVARLYAEVKLRTDIVRDALRQDAPPVALRPPSTTSLPAKDAARSPAARRYYARWGNALAMILAASLVLMLGVQLWRIERPGHAVSMQGAPVRTTAIVPRSPAAKASSPVAVMTRNLAGEPVPTPVEAEVLNSDNEVLWRYRGNTGPDGTLQVQVPVAHVVPNNSLRLLAAGNRDDEALVANFSVLEPERSTYLMTDRPVYAPGETMYFRSLTLPKLVTGQTADGAVRFEVHDPRGRVYFEQTGITEQGVAAGELPLGAQASEGLYALVARSPDGQFRETRREFVVQPDREKRLHIHVAFDRTTYRPSDAVVAAIGVETLDRQPVAGAALRCEVWVDGQPLELPEAPQTASVDGTAQLRIELPSDLAVGDALLRVSAGRDATAGFEQSIVQRIPVEVPVAMVQLLPEGGELVAGVPNRLYFSATNPAGRPIDFQGRLVDEGGSTVAELLTDAQGRGVVELIAQTGTYRVELDAPPEWTLEATPLTCTPERFATLNTGSSVFAAGEPLRLALYANDVGRSVALVATAGGVDVGNLVVTTSGDPSGQWIELPLAETAQGVIRLTLFDAEQQPPQAVAERLVYRRPAERLHLQARRNQLSAGAQTWNIEVADQNGDPTDALLGIAVVGGKPERRWRDSELPDPQTAFLLLDAIDHPEELENADVYLGEDPAAERALDLLLGVRGWRRIDSAGDVLLARAGQLASQPAVVSSPVEPPQMLDNLAQIHDRQRLAMDYEYSAATQRRAAARLLLPVGALAVVILLGMALFRLAHVWTWVPAVGVAAASVLVGMLWLTADAPSGATVASNKMASGEVPDSIALLADGTESASADLEAAPDAKQMGRPPMEHGESQESLEFSADNRPSAGAMAPVVPPAPLELEADATERLSRSNDFPAEAAPESSLAAGIEARYARPLLRAPAPLADELARRNVADREAAAGEPPAAQRGAEPLPQSQPSGRFSRSIDREATAELRKSNDERTLSQQGDEPAPAVAATDSVDGRGGAMGAAPGAAEFGAPSLVTRGEAEFGRDAAVRSNQFRTFAYQPPSAGVPGAAGAEAPVTLFWDPKRPAVNGNAAFDFAIPADLESVQLMAVAHTTRGIGSLHETFEIRPPLTLDAPRLTRLSVGDRFQLPVTITNYLPVPVNVELSYTVNGEDQLADDTGNSSGIRVEGGSATIHLLPLFEAREVGPAQIAIEANASEGEAELQLPTVITPLAPAMYWQHAAIAANARPEVIEMPALPEAFIGRFSLRGYPSLAAELRDGIETLGRQLVETRRELAAAATSVQNWFANAGVGDPELAEQLRTWREFGISATGEFEQRSQQITSTLRSDIAAREKTLDFHAQDTAQAGTARPLAEILTEQPQRLAETLAQRQRADGSVPELGDQTLDQTTAQSPVAKSAIAAVILDREHGAEASRARRWLRTQRSGDGGFGRPDATSLAVQALTLDPQRPAVAPDDVRVELYSSRQRLTDLRVAAGSSRPVEWRQWGDLPAEQPIKFELRVSGVDELPYVLETVIYGQPDASQRETELVVSSQLESDQVALGESTTLRITAERRRAADVRLVVTPPSGVRVDQRTVNNQLARRALDYTWRDDGELVIEWPGAADAPEGGDTENRLELAVPLEAVVPGQFQVVPVTASYSDAPSRWAASSRVALRVVNE